ncbi:hybrid sensor histidine kinase/response regulator, partial [Bdellovibrionota bacterium FG-1]
ITEAENGEKALEILLSELSQGRHFAGAIVDVRMPGKLDGLQFIREAWKADPGLLVVVATAYQDRSVDEIHRVFSAQFQDQWDYLAKPFTSGEIIQKARQLVSSWNRRERERAHLRQIETQQHTLVAQEKLAVLGRLARNVGHEFGNLLQPLLAKIELARIRSTPELYPLFDEMLDTTDLAALICQDLLTFGRESHESSAPPEITIQSPVDRVLRILSHAIKIKQAQIHLSLPESFSVRIHEEKLVQILMNLLTNSLDAIQPGGTIRIESTASTHSCIEIRITDNGCGIQKDILPMVFLPLFTTKGQNGNGIGMAVCKQIVESYEGAISLESTVGDGTTVRFNLPGTVSAVEAAPAPQN